MKMQLAVAATLSIIVCAIGIKAQVIDKRTITCEVLEVPGDYRGDVKQLGDRKELSAINYLIIRHQRAEDRSRLSAWLRSESGAVLTFTTGDGVRHRGVLRRLKMCFGRGLLVFIGPVNVKERDSIVVELQPLR